jgi:hypothetical protein
MSNCSQPLGLGLSEELGVDEYRKQYEHEWEPTEQERKAAELAERYHRETEGYDRTVCTGPVVRGSIMPIGPHEMALVNRNAIKVRERIMAEAAAAGISAEDMRRAIGRHA